MDNKTLYFYIFRKEWTEICEKLKASGYDLSKIKIVKYVRRHTNNERRVNLR